MAPCTTTGTTWETCGHSIYQHQPTCNHRGRSCTKNSLLQPGICPSCTLGDFYPPPEPPRLPDHLNRSDKMTPVKIKKESANENDNMALVKREEAMHPDDYLKIEYEKHRKELAEKSGNVYNGEGGASGGLFGRPTVERTSPRKVFCRKCGDEGHESRDCGLPRDESRVRCSNCQEMGHPKVRCPKGIAGVGGGTVFSGGVKQEKKGDASGGGSGVFGGTVRNENTAGQGSGVSGGAVAEDKMGKDYFLEFHIKQLEEKLEAARLREAENNVQIGNLQAQVGLLRDPPTERGYAISASIRDTSSQLECYSKSDSTVSPFDAHLQLEDSPIAAQNHLAKPEPSKMNPMIDVREQIRGNRVQVNNGYQAGGSQTQDHTQGGAQVNEGERGRNTPSVNHQQLPNPRPHGGRVKQADKIPPLKKVVANELRAENSAPVQQAEALSNGQVPTNGAQSTAPQAPVELSVALQAALHDPLPIDINKKQLFDIAAISFSSQLAVKLINLKDALNINQFDTWFDRQVAHSFKCAKELDFFDMLKGYKDFVDWIGIQLEKGHRARLDEDNVNSALKESEKMVQVLMDIEMIIVGST